jgi:hypothetical protein
MTIAVIFLYRCFFEVDRPVSIDPFLRRGRRRSPLFNPLVEGGKHNKHQQCRRHQATDDHRSEMPLPPRQRDVSQP